MIDIVECFKDVPRAGNVGRTVALDIHRVNEEKYE